MPQLIIIGGGPRYTYNGAATTQTSSASFSFTSQALGDAAPDRFVVVVIEVFTSGTNFAVTAVDIAGSTASEIVTRDDSGGTQKVHTAMWGATVASGTSGTIAVTFAGSVSRCKIANYALYGLSSTTAAHTASDGGGSGDTSASVTIDVPAAGILLSSAAYVNSADVQTLSGVTVDDSFTEATVIQFTWGSRQASSPEVGASITWSGTAAAGSARSLVAASWS